MFRFYSLMKKHHAFHHVRCKWSVSSRSQQCLAVGEHVDLLILFVLQWEWRTKDGFHKETGQVCVLKCMCACLHSERRTDFMSRGRPTLDGGGGGPHLGKEEDLFAT